MPCAGATIAHDSPTPHLTMTRRTLAPALALALVLPLLAACADATSPASGLTEGTPPVDSTRTPAPPATTGALEIVVTGLPAGVAARIVVAAPNGADARTVAASTALEALAPATYSVAADTVTVDGVRWAPSRAFEIAHVTAGARVVVPVTYARVHVGTVRFAMSGVPAPRAARWELQTPEGQVLLAGEVAAGDTAVRTGLPAGTYWVRWPEVRASLAQGTHSYGADVERVAITVPDAATPVDAFARFALTSGTVRLAVDGVPAGVPVHWRLAAPEPDAGFAIEGLATAGVPAFATWYAGDYAVEWGSLLVRVDDLGHTLMPVVGRMPVTVPRSLEPVTVTARYEIATGVVRLTATGLPAGRVARFELHHADATIAPEFEGEAVGFAFFAGTVGSGETVVKSNLRPGRWTLRWFDVVSDTALLRPAIATQVLEVPASWTPVAAAAAYSR